MKRSAVPRKRKGPARRTSVYRNRAYLDWLRTLKCVACGREAECDPAHGPSAAMRVKSGDDGAIPLCRSCHIKQHAIGWPEFDKRMQINREKIAARLFADFEAYQRENPTECLCKFDAMCCPVHDPSGARD